MALKSRLHHPPGGFKFYQPETDWTAPEWLSFAGLVSQVIEHRKANPRFNLSTDLAQVEHEVDEQNAARMKAMPGGSEYITGDTSPPVFTFPPRQRRAVAGVAASVKRAVAGAGLLLDWLGEGAEPVAVALAHHRAAVCVDCPFNQEPTAGEAALGAVAEGFRLLIDAKNEMDLSTPRDALLKTCERCSCKLTLKIWAPHHHVMAHITPEIYASLPPHCWIVQERA